MFPDIFGGHLPPQVDDFPPFAFHFPVGNAFQAGKTFVERLPHPGGQQFGNVFQRRLAVTDRSEQLGVADRMQPNVKMIIEFFQILPVEIIQRLQDQFLAVGRRRQATVRERDHPRPVQETKEIRRIGKSVRRPDHLDETIPVDRAELHADADIHRHDRRRLQQLVGSVAGYVIIVDHLQLPDAFDPGVHDQMGRRLPPLGVGIVDMGVKRQLGPAFRHFKQIIALQQPADEARLAEQRPPQFMCQLQTADLIGPFADQLLHQLQQHPGGIVPKPAADPGDHFIVQRLKRSPPCSKVSSRLYIAATIRNSFGAASSLMPRG